MLFGEEWYRYFQETYGADNVEWTSGIIEDMFRTQGWGYAPYTGKVIKPQYYATDNLRSYIENVDANVPRKRGIKK